VFGLSGRNLVVPKDSERRRYLSAGRVGNASFPG
jgi:hypothetical protein